MDKLARVHNISLILHKIMNLNEYLVVLDRYKEDIILLGSICDEGSKKWDQIHFPEDLQNIIKKPNYREGLSLIWDAKTNTIQCNTDTSTECEYSTGELKLFVRSEGFTSQISKGISKFVINDIEFIYEKRGLNLIILSHQGYILDIFNVDTYSDSSIHIVR